MPTKQNTDQALRIAELTRYALYAIQQETGANLAILLAGAHAEIATATALAFGRETAIGQCEAAAERIRNLPSREDMTLANATPAGHA